MIFWAFPAIRYNLLCRPEAWTGTIGFSLYLAIYVFNIKLWKIYIRIIHNDYWYWILHQGFFQGNSLYLIGRQQRLFYTNTTSPILVWINIHSYKTLVIIFLKKDKPTWIHHTFSRHALYLWFYLPEKGMRWWRIPI
jgi:hypothetical protein